MQWQEVGHPDETGWGKAADGKPGWAKIGPDDRQWDEKKEGRRVGETQEIADARMRAYAEAERAGGLGTWGRDPQMDEQMEREQVEEQMRRRREKLRGHLGQRVGSQQWEKERTFIAEEHVEKESERVALDRIGAGMQSVFDSVYARSSPPQASSLCPAETPADRMAMAVGRFFGAAAVLLAFVLVTFFCLFWIDRWNFRYGTWVSRTVLFISIWMWWMRWRPSVAA